ncbi:MAG: protein kinase [Bdellovibrionaceae bacterium]|nr:protein kinase [Pseudobdellovibrionaceae bacterium]
MPKKFQPQSFSYNVCAKIGEGLHSEVYKVVKADESHNLSQVMALKILKSKVLADIWKREFESLSKIFSNYCVRILGWEWILGRPALVLEYIEGVSLQNLLDQGSLSILEINCICTQLYWGLSDLQKFGVAHGDINPRNILFTLQGSLKLIDFGVQGESLEVLYTSPKFCAPELFYEKQPCYESDLYSLGILRQLLLQSSGIELKKQDLEFFNILTSANPKERSSAFLEKKNALQEWFYSDEEVKSLCKKIAYSFLQSQKHQEKTKKIENFHLFPGADKNERLRKIIFKLNLWLPKSLQIIKVSLLQSLLKSSLYLFFIANFLMFMPYSSPINKPLKFAQAYSSLSIFTDSWKKVFIDEVFVGYTPVISLSLRVGWHHMQWVSGQDKGQATFFVPSKAPLILQSSFFKR